MSYWPVSPKTEPETRVRVLRLLREQSMNHDGDGHREAW